MPDALQSLGRDIQAKIDRLSEWIVSDCKYEGEFSLETDLIEQRIVTSLQFVELVLLVEELRGREITEAERDLEHFRTLQGIVEHYFSA